MPIRIAMMAMSTRPGGREFHEASRAENDRAIIKFNVIAPRKMDAAGQEVAAGIHFPAHNPDQHILVGCLEGDNPVADQRPCFRARKKINFAVER